MKKQLLFTVVVVIILFLIPTALSAQVGINTDNSQPDPSAILDLKSTIKGFLPPRMTMAQINSIPNPTEGLLVYNTSIHCPVYFDSTGWKRTDGLFYIGANYGGGVIFYIDSTGQHGLIAAPFDQTISAPWGCWTQPAIGTTTGIGAGQANTTAMVNGCNDPWTAARTCDTLVLNGYSDWFLPSKDELNQLYLHQSVFGGIYGSVYITSSEQYGIYGWYQDFFAGYQIFCFKYQPGWVRAVRTF